MMKELVVSVKFRKGSSELTIPIACKHFFFKGHHVYPEMNPSWSRNICTIKAKDADTAEYIPAIIKSIAEKTSITGILWVYLLRQGIDIAFIKVFLTG